MGKKIVKVIKSGRANLKSRVFLLIFIKLAVEVAQTLTNNPVALATPKGIPIMLSNGIKAAAPPEPPIAKTVDKSKVKKKDSA